jgi:tetratricopeptide (TPR) repeat protein
MRSEDTPDGVEAAGDGASEMGPFAGGVEIAARRTRRVADREGDERGGAAEQLMASAQASEGRGDLASAILLYREVIRADNSHVRARIALGVLYARRGEHALALEQLEAARELAPDSVDALIGIAGSLTELKRYEHAEAALKRALRLEPTRADVHGSMGTLNYKRGLYGQAEQELKRALDLDPTYGVAYFYRGECLNQLGRVDEALEMLERSVQLHPRNPRAFFTMGILYDRKHLPQQAAAMYRKAREVTPA